MIRAFFWWVIWLVIFVAASFLLMAALYDLLTVPLTTPETWGTAICAAVGVLFIIYNFIRLRRRRKRQKTNAEILQELIEQRSALRSTKLRY